MLVNGHLPSCSWYSSTAIRIATFGVRQRTYMYAKPQLVFINGHTQNFSWCSSTFYSLCCISITIKSSLLWVKSLMCTSITLSRLLLFYSLCCESLTLSSLLSSYSLCPYVFHTVVTALVRLSLLYVSHTVVTAWSFSLCGVRYISRHNCKTF